MNIYVNKKDPKEKIVNVSKEDINAYIDALRDWNSPYKKIALEHSEKDNKIVKG